MISVHPQDQTYIKQREVLADLEANRVPVVWKKRFWGTPRDWKLLDRLRLFPKLEDVVGHGSVRWIIGQGFQEPGPSDGPKDRKQLSLPTRNLVEARNRHFSLFLLESDCDQLPARTVTVRSRSNTNTEVFRGPHVLISDGFKVAFADFDAAFRQSVRAISGAVADAKLLFFLTAYLNSPLARYYLFHTAANIGVERAKAESGDVLRLPFPLPDDAPSRKRPIELVERAYAENQQAVRQAPKLLSDRAAIVRSCATRLSALVYDYFDIDENERMLVEDTNAILLRSVRRKRALEEIPTLQASTKAVRDQYEAVACATLNDWARSGPYEVHASTETSASSGVAVVTFTRLRRGSEIPQPAPAGDGFVLVFERLQRVLKKQVGTIELLKELKVFDQNKLYVLKPLSQRFWTRSAALNDADQIAESILTQSLRGQR